MCSILSQSAINSNKYASYCDLLNMWGSNEQRIKLYGDIDALEVEGKYIPWGGN